ncbi:MAG: hypothetical protein NNC33_00710 [Candidatus Nanosyncoccus sp. P13S_S20_bin.18.1]|nr:hypothetical protein [Candidatus Nanosyncoccus sp. P13S_S20_bin.18.1]
MIKFGKTEKILSGILAGLLVVLAIAFGVKSCQRNHADTEAETLSAKDVEAEKSELTFDFDNYEYAKAYPELSREFCDNSMPNKAAERVAGAGFSDALSTPFSVTHGTKDGEKYSEEELVVMAKEYRQEVLTNPPVTHAVLTVLTGMTVSDGTSIVQINSWMTDRLNEYSESMKNGTGNQDYLREQDGVLYANDRQIKVGVATLWLLDRFVNQGVQLVTTNHHYPLSLANADSAKLTTFERADYEFTRDAMVLSYTNKAGSEIFKIGINTHDKRPELIKVKITEKKQKETESSTKESSTQTSTESSTESSTKESETERSTERRRRGGGGGGGGNNHHENQPEKKPSQDPVNNGGAQIGGGNTTVGSDAYEPTDPAVRTDGGHEKPERVKPETPTPDQSHQNVETQKTDDIKMNYETEAQRNDNFTNNKGETINHGVDNSGKSLQKDDYVGFVNSDDEEPK